MIEAIYAYIIAKFLVIAGKEASSLLPMIFLDLT